MPTVGVVRDDLFARLGKTYTEKEFDELCFDFGIELDEVVIEQEVAGGGARAAIKKAAKGAEQNDGKTVYKIDIPANRYDLLCIEGLARALNIFLGREEAPVFKCVEPATGERQKIVVKKGTLAVRPFVVCAVLRGLTLDEKSYQSIIDLQEKLHENICRRRTLVAIGTHDLSTLQGPFTYMTKEPQSIEFVPLTPADRGPIKGKDLLDFYNTDKTAAHLKAYVPLIYNCEEYPVIYDSERTLLSMPPIINGHHSRITLNTTDMFIECTATDETKANVVLDTVVTMFSEYCSNKFTVEPVDVVYEGRGEGGTSITKTTPLLSCRKEEALVADIRSIIGVQDMTAEQMCTYCTKMQLGPAEHIHSRSDIHGGGGGDSLSGGDSGDIIRVTVPPTRSDVLHAIDIVEDIAIAFGYNNIVKRIPATQTVGAPLPLNHFCDLLRDEIGRAGFCEMLNHGLCSLEENFTLLRRPIGPAVTLSNPTIVDYQVVRTTLLPGALKSLQCNRDVSVRDGLRLFEISDVVLRDSSSDTGARNCRRLVATYTGMTAGFEVIHGLLDRLMMVMQIPPHESYATDSKGGLISMGGPWRESMSYRIVAATNESFFPGRCAEVVLEKDGKETKLGYFGVIHPEVLLAFGLSSPASALELDLEPLH